MNKKELKAKRAVIRNEIKERMQDELDRRKEEIKRRIKGEDISVEEKREKYRRETDLVLARLMRGASGEAQLSYPPDQWPGPPGGRPPGLHANAYRDIPFALSAIARKEGQ